MIVAGESAAFGIVGLLLLAAAVWLGPVGRDAGGQRHRLRSFALPAGVALILLAGWGAAAWRAGVADAVMRDRLEHQARAIAGAINPVLVRRLSFSIADRGAPAFERLHEQLSAYGRAIRQRSIYTMALRDGRMVFGPESLAADDPLALPPGSPYLGPPAILDEVFRAGTGATFGPYDDEYGRFISGYAPVIDPRTGETVMVVGLDLVADLWEKDLARARLGPLVFAVAFALVPLVAALVWRRSGGVRTRRSVWLSDEVLLTALCGLLLTVALSFMAGELELQIRRQRFAQVSDGYALGIGKEIRLLRDVSIAGVARLTEAGGGDAAGIPGRVESVLPSSIVMGYGWIPAAAASSGSCRDDPRRCRAIAMARATGFPTATEPLPLRTEGGEAEGIAVYQPVAVRSDGEPAGFLVAELPFGALLGGTLAMERRREPVVDVHLFFLADEGPPQLVASWPSAHDRDEGAPIPGRDWSEASIDPFFFFGRALALVSHPGPAFTAVYPIRLWWGTVVTGLALTALVVVTVGVLIDRRARLEREVAERTAALRETQERFAQMAEQSREIIWEIDAEGLFTYVSRACSLLLGYAPEEVVGTMHFYDLHPEAGREEFKRRAFEILRRKGPFVDMANAIVGKNGRELLVLTNGVPILDAEGNLAGYRGSDRDVTERAAAERALQAKMAEIAKLNQLMLGREDRVIELKNEVNELLKHLNRPPKYGV